MRNIFMLLSPRALGYARLALRSLLRNSLEPLDLRLVTDSAEDKSLLAEEMAGYEDLGRHRWTVHAKDDLRDSEAAIFGGRPNLRLFRDGHPCWRKITDPLLLSGGSEEIVVLDPDLYFPNRFRFEATPDSGVLLMWQRPNCLLPRDVVEEAFRKKIPLAHHVDIGVAHWRANPDLDWLEWLLNQLGLKDRPYAKFAMHIEAIVWAAIAMRVGGGYLSPRHWYCWHRSQRTRVLRKLGVPGYRLLAWEPLATVKCFHAGGEAKHWLVEANRRGLLDGENLLDALGRITPFIELSPGAYLADQRRKALLRRAGYYKLFSSVAPQ